MILIVIKVKIRPEKRDEWLVGLKQYTADVRQEPGNVSFDYYENSENPNEFAIIETFADSDAGSAHVATEHAQIFSSYEWISFATAGVVLGTMLGIRFLRGISEATFRSFLGALIFTLGVYMIARGGGWA